MSKQFKDILGILIITVPLFVLLYVGWHFTPMYKQMTEFQRLEVQIYLINTYFYNELKTERQELIEKYGFTDDEINPAVFLNQTRCNQYLGGIE